MKKDEKTFQNYFMSIGKPLNYHRTALATGGGYPDITGFHGAKYSLVELKDILLGKRGDLKLGGCFELTQPPWYVKYFQGGGNRLFVAFRIRDWDESNKRYGLWQLTKRYALELDTMYYSDMIKSPNYKEYSTGKELVLDIVNWGEDR